MATQDWIVLAYHAVVWVAVLLARKTPAWGPVFLGASLMLFGYAGAMYLIRGRALPSPLLRSVGYRFAIVGSVQGSYLIMRWLLPVVNPGTLDAQLYQIDLDLFGFEPAISLAPYVNGPLTEWFSFAYYGYFIFLLGHVFPIVFAASHRRAQVEFSLGLVIVFCTGQALYMAVPGYGPGVAFPELFSTGFPSGFFYNLMLETVADLGAQKDIFPSIHTAVPTFMCLWAYRYRKTRVFLGDGLLAPVYRSRGGQWLLEKGWPLSLAFSANIVAATMYLRWHYLIDVVLGAMLGVTGFLLAVRFVAPELQRRDARQLGAVWPPIERPEYLTGS